MTTQIIAHHCNRCAIIRPACHVERITAAATHDLHLHTVRRAGDKERVISFHAVHGYFLNFIVPNRQARTVHAVIGNDKIIPKLSTQYMQGIKSVTPYHVDRGIYRILDKVSALTAVNVRKRRLGIVGVYLNKGPNPE